MNEFTVSEKQARGILGLGEDGVLRLRDMALANGVDYVRRRDGLRYSTEGIAKMAAARGATLAEAGAAIAQEAAGGPDDLGGCGDTAGGCDRGTPGQGAGLAGEKDAAPERLVVLRLYPNERWVRAIRPNGEKVDCEVHPTNRYLVRGRMLPDCVRRTDGRWEYPKRTI